MHDLERVWVVETLIISEPIALDDHIYANGPGTGRRGPDKRPRKRMTPVSGPFSRALRRGAIDNRSREGRFLSAARHRLIQHLGGDPSTTQLVLIDRIAWLMLHCFMLDQRIAAGGDWGENDRKCYLAFSNSLVRSLREIGLEATAEREPTLAEVLKARRVTIDAPHPLDFFAKLRWLDGRPLLDTIEPYRQAIFETVLYSLDGNRPQYNLAVCGRAKNWKTSDLILAALYRLLVWPSPQGNDCFILANDEAQAGDDLDLAKKLVTVNPIIAREVELRAKESYVVTATVRMQILPARDIAGAHGKTYLFDCHVSLGVGNTDLCVVYSGLDPLNLTR